MIKCPSCSHENVDGTTFCEMCGEDLQSTGSAVASAVDAGSTPGAASGSAEIKCPACDNMNPADNVACEICGTPLHDNAGDSAYADLPAPITTPPPAPIFNDADTTPVSNADAAATSADVPDAGSTPSAPDVLTVADIATSPPPGGAVAASTPDVDTALSSSTAPDTSGGALAPGKVKLVVEQGMTVGKQFVLGDSELQIGREDSDEDIYPDIDLADQDEGYVHRQHATLKFENDKLFVTHLGGANKTRINNKPIPDNEAQPVSMGDKIAFGKVVMRVMPL